MEGMLADRDVPQRECYGIGDVPLAKARPIGEMGGGVARKTWFHPTASIASLQPPAATSAEKLKKLFMERGDAGQSIGKDTICEVLAEEQKTLDVKVSLIKSPTNHQKMRFNCEVDTFLDYKKLHAKISGLFCLEHKELILSYRDSEDDRINVASNVDLSYFLNNFMKEGSTVKMEVVIKNPVSTVLKSKTASQLQWKS